MIYHFNKNGALIEQISDYTLSNGAQSFDATAGNYAVDVIYAVFDGIDEELPTTQGFTITYTKPNGEKFTPYDISCDASESLSINYDAKRDMRTLRYGKEYLMFRFDFPDGLISEGGEGAYSATIRLVSVSDDETTSIRAYGLITFGVKEGVTQSDSYVSASNFDYLLSKVNTFTAKTNAIVDCYASYGISSVGKFVNIKLYEDAEHTAIIDPAAEENARKAFLDLTSGSAHYMFASDGSAWYVVSGNHLVIGTVAGTAFEGSRGKALEDTVVYVSGEQTVSGVKHFSNGATFGTETVLKINAGGTLDYSSDGVTYNSYVFPSGSGTFLLKEEKGKADGIAPLNGSAKIDAQYLPSYVDDVIDCYATYAVSDTGVISGITLYSDAEHETELDPTDSDNEGKIFVDATSGNPGYQFRTTGTAWARVGGDPLVLGTVTGTAYDGGKGTALEATIEDIDTAVTTLQENVVTLGDNQTITGDKTFTGDIILGSNAPIEWYINSLQGYALLKEVDMTSGHVTSTDTTDDKSIVNYGTLNDAMPQITDISED